MYSWNCCRLCLNTDNLNPIFSSPEQHDLYTRIILESCGIQVELNDALPQKICTTCITNINNNYKFRKKCTESQRTLETQLRNGDVLVKNEFERKTEGSNAIDITDLIHDKSCDRIVENYNFNIDNEVFNNIDKGDCNKSIELKIQPEDKNLKAKCNRKRLNNNQLLADIDNSNAENIIGDVLKLNDKIFNHSNKIDNSVEVSAVPDFDSVNSKTNEADVKLNCMSKRSKRNVKRKIEIVDDVNIPLDDSICDDNVDEEMSLGKDILPRKSNTDNTKKLSQKSKVKAIKREKKDKTKKSKKRGGKESKKEAAREPVECEYCHKILSSRLSIPNHYKIHTGFNIVCEHCGKKFISRRILLMHCRARHGYEKTDKCRYCDYRGSNADQVKIHERLHTGEKPFVCKECGAAFIRSSTYLQHTATHLTEKNVQCDQCPARFKSVTLMKIHKNKHKPKQYIFKCRICNNSFMRKRNVTRHLERIHKLQPEPGLLERVRVGNSELDKS